MSHTGSKWGVVTPRVDVGVIGDPGDLGIYAETERGRILIGEFFQDGNATWTRERVPVDTAANARLATAAPDLLAALEAINDLPSAEINPSNYSHDDVVHLNNTYVEMALAVQAAIAIAGGHHR